jgi:hemoglobin-like flavoprotein
MNLTDSLGDILDSDLRFGRAFYETFFKRYPQVENYFEGVNMHRQAAILTMTLLVIENYRAAQRPAMATYLGQLGARHKEWGIPLEMYDYFRDALLETLAQFHGKDWNDALALQWDTAIDHTIRTMVKGYETQPDVAAVP